MNENIEKKRNSIEFEVSGKYALFSDPVIRVGGEKYSYEVPTYQALKGITESIYWKPTFIWVIDAVRVMNKIQTEGKGVRPIKFDKEENDLAFYTYLKDVRYKVLAHFEWNENRPELTQDRNENKHHNITKRMIERGGRRDIFLGTRECQGYVEPTDFFEGESFYDNYGEINFGFILHGIDYPDETGRSELGVRFCDYVMKDGIIQFPTPKDPCLKTRKVRDIKDIKMFDFALNNISSVDEEERLL